MAANAHDIPQRLLQRLDDLGNVLAGRGDALALLGLGSVGVDVGRLDDHSDLDFFVVVDEGAKERYLASIDWLEELHPVVFSFPNSIDGRKALFADGLFAEYAIFTLDELRGASYPPGRIVWRRDDAPSGLESLGRMPGPSPSDNADYQVNEALTNLYVGLHRDLRGERLSAMRLIQVHAVDRLLTYLHLTEPGTETKQDAFAVERGAERSFGPGVLPLAKLVPGYEHNREAALALLEWLEARAEVSDVLAAAIRQLALEPEAQLAVGSVREELSVSDGDVAAHILASAEAGALLRMCAWCERILLEDEWLQPARVALAAIDVRNAVSHTICPECAEAHSRTFSG